MIAEEKGPIANFFDRLPRFAAGVAVLVGLAVILGWFFDWEKVRRVVPGMSEMRFNTAFGFLLSGVSLWCARATPRGRYVLSDLFAGMVVLLGSLTLLEFWTGADLGIDQLVVKDPFDYPEDAPGRMALNSAVSFVPLGGALLLLNRGKIKDNAVIQSLAFVPLLIGGSALMSYGYDTGDFLRWKLNYLPMAVHTSVLFVLLSLGILSARPEFPFRHWMSNPGHGGRSLRILVPGLVLFTLLLGWLIDAGIDRGYLQDASGLALFSVANIVGMGCLILWNMGRFIQSDERRERAEREMMESQELLLSVIENIPTAIFLRDARDGTLQMMNRAAEEILGLDPAKVLGKSIFEIYPKAQADLFLSSDEELIRRGGVLDLPEVAVSTPGKGDRLFHTRKVLIQGQDGKPRFFMGLSEDITEQKLMAQAREKLEEQLKVAQKMEAIGTLAGGVAHDFNNILGVILTYTSFLLADMDPGDPRREDLQEVKNSADRAAVLTRQLLAFGHKQMVRPVTLDLNEVTRSLGKMLRRVLGEDIDLTWSLDQGLVPILADPGQMEQVIMNLVVNARDAMPEGGKLHITTSNQEVDAPRAVELGLAQPGTYVLLTISDTGCGMEEGVKERIFEPFFTTKPKGKGTGLGLSTVYGIVQQTKGGLSFVSEVGKGTTFRIYFPQDRTGKLPEAKTTVPPELTGGQGTILLVEDETALLKAARRALESVGYKVMEASDGEKAIQVSARYPGTIDLLLTDVVMPGMDGVATGRAILEKRPGLRILYMSGYSDHNGTRMEVLEPWNHFIQKPFTLEVFTLKVREVLDRGKSAPLVRELQTH